MLLWPLMLTFCHSIRFPPRGQKGLPWAPLRSRYACNSPDGRNASLTQSKPLFERLKGKEGVLYYRLPPNDIPAGWLNDPEQLELAPKAEDLEELGYHVETKETTAILIRDGPEFLIEGDKSYYIWNPTAWSLELVEEPMSLKEILARLHSKGTLKRSC